MIPTLVIALREGVEASLIVGIVAAFLVKEGHREALKPMWIGVGIAVVLCTAIAVGLRVVDDQLPQRQQEGLETVVGLIAVSMISYMIIWMRRNSRGLKQSLEGDAAMAIAAGSTIGLVAMAFLAVLREGFETAVFMLAAFQDTENPLAAGFGAVIGLLAAIILGYLIYRGGVRINLSRFFRVTGLILVFVAAGLLATAVHTAHEAGWINSMQGQAMDLTWLVQPGTISGALLTGMLGLQPKPTTGESLAYLLYAVPMGLFVIWPDTWHPFRKLTARRSAGAAATAITAVALLIAGCGSGDDPPAGATKLSFTLTDAGCDPTDASAPAGPITFEIANDGADAVTELEILDGDKILGERENLTDGLNGDFSLNLDAGEYTVYCPGGDTERGTLTVTGGGGAGSTSASPNAAAAIKNYRGYVETSTGDLVAKTKVFTDAVEAGDAEQARAAYAAAAATRSPTASSRSRESSTRALLHRLPARPQAPVRGDPAAPRLLRRAQRVHKARQQRRLCDPARLLAGWVRRRGPVHLAPGRRLVLHTEPPTLRLSDHVHRNSGTLTRSRRFVRAT